MGVEIILGSSSYYMGCNMVNLQKGTLGVTTAELILREALSVMKKRSRCYDKGDSLLSTEGTRYMGKAVRMFKELVGTAITEEQGYLFMTCIKMARSQQNTIHLEDNHVDGAAYMALAGEASKEGL